VTERIPTITERNLPNLFIVGVSRGGTTSLFEYLGQHPDVYTSDIKELRYFSALRYGEPLGDLDAYAAHFAGSRHRYSVEATPGYFYGGRPLARALLATCPGARAMVSLRSPEDRCWSWFQFVKSRTRIPRDMTFDGYLDRCEELHEAGEDGSIENQPYWGLGGGCYAEWLPAWIDELGQDFKILFFDDLKANPRSTMEDIYSWLALDIGAVNDSAMRVNNKAEQYRLRRLQKVALKINRSGEAFFHRHPEMKRSLRRAYYSVNKAPAEPPMSASAKARMEDFFKPHNALLAEQLTAVGMSLPKSW
jgi:hypothetical protein